MYFRIRAPPRSPRGTSRLGSPPGPPSSLEVGPSPLARVYPAGRGGPGSPPSPVGPRNHPGTIPPPPRPATRPNPAGYPAHYPAGYRFEPKTRAGRVGPGRPGRPGSPPARSVPGTIPRPARPGAPPGLAMVPEPSPGPWPGRGPGSRPGWGARFSSSSTTSTWRSSSGWSRDGSGALAGPEVGRGPGLFARDTVLMAMKSGG